MMMMMITIAKMTTMTMTTMYENEEADGGNDVQRKYLCNSGWYHEHQHQHHRLHTPTPPFHTPLLTPPPPHPLPAAPPPPFLLHLLLLSDLSLISVASPSLQTKSICGINLSC